MEPAKQFMESSRFWVQRVLVPILVLVGVGGNVVTVMVLTRRRMRCSTNIYLTALAVADLIFLLFVLILSFEHYPNINDIRYELYWRFYGINHWFADAANSTSIWLIVCFTVERYIAVCHPIRGKVLCTENRAKRVIAAVSILCILATITTSLEYQLTTSDYCEQKTCLSITENGNYSEEFNITNDINTYVPTPNDMLEKCVNETKQFCQDDDSDCHSKKEEMLALCINETLFDQSLNDCCVKSIQIQTEPTNLGKNATYKTIFYWFTCITFTLLPLTLIATFNCFLVNAVRKSQKQRKQMTKMQENSTQTQEHRMTLILIAVVILFLICQTPTACILIYTSIYPNLDIQTEYLVRGLGNVFNLLVSINAACNFLLYCALSDKYRCTFRALFCRRRGGRGVSGSWPWQDTSVTTLSGRSYRSVSGAGKDNGLKRNVSAYVPRKCQTETVNTFPRAKTMIVRPTGKRPVGKLV